MARKNRVEEDAEIDMTPMLDIVFIMLIFFIVTTVFVKEAGIEVNKPKREWDSVLFMRLQEEIIIRNKDIVRAAKNV